MKSYLVILIFLFALTLPAQQYIIPTSIISSGGGTINNESYSISGTAGQPAIGVLSGSSFMQTAGFWHSQFVFTDVNDELKSKLPVEYKLEQNYPNPFNPSTIIQYQLPTASNVSLYAYDIIGRKVAVLINNEWKEAGYHHYKFSAAHFNLSSGVYLYRLQAGDYTSTKKFILIK